MLFYNTIRSIIMMTAPAIPQGGSPFNISFIPEITPAIIRINEITKVHFKTLNIPNKRRIDEAISIIPAMKIPPLREIKICVFNYNILLCKIQISIILWASLKLQYAVNITV